MRILHCTWAILAILAIPGDARAQGARPGEAGYTLFLRGTPIGRETITVSNAASGTTITGIGSAGAPFNSVFDLVEYRYGAAGSPQSFELNGTLGGANVELRTTFANGTASTQGSQGGQSISATHQVSASTVVLAPGIFSGFAALAQRLANAKGGDEFSAFLLPRVEVKATVVTVTSERIQIDTSLFPVRRYELSFADPAGELLVYLTASPEGQLVRVSVPSQWLDFVRNDVATVTARTDIHSNPGDVPVIIPAAGFNIGATITLPAAAIGADPAKSTVRYPAVVLIAGPDAVDRDAIAGGVPGLGQLAGALAGAGIISVRYDRRGSGQSGGRAESALLADYAEDARTVAKWLTSRKDVDSRRVAALGHDLGGWFALQAARDDRIRAVVLLGVPSSPGAEFALEQQRLQLDRMNTPAADRDARIALQRQIHEAVLSGRGWDSIAVELRRQADTPWFGSFLRFDPARAVADVDPPLLIVHGELDREVPVAHATRLADAARQGDSDLVSLVVVPGVNHLLQPATTGEVAEYQALTGKGVSPSVVSAVVTWLQTTLPERGK